MFQGNDPEPKKSDHLLMLEKAEKHPPQRIIKELSLRTF